MDHFHKASGEKCDTMTDEQQLSENQKLISNNMVSVLTPATSPDLSTSISNATSTFTTNQISKPMTNGLNENNTELICRSNSTSSNSSDLLLSKTLSTTPNSQQINNNQLLNSSASFPFFNAFNLLHPILNKHLYSNDGLNFNPFASAYLTQLQNVKQQTNSPSLVNSNNNSVLVSTSMNSTTNTNSIISNPQHVLRKDEINSLISGITKIFYCQL